MVVGTERRRNRLKSDVTTTDTPAREKSMEWWSNIGTGLRIWDRHRRRLGYIFIKIARA
jgi:hypothetical protein